VTRRGLTALLEPRSLAVVGASARAGSFGDQLVGQLLAGGYRGTVHLVNPRYREVAGLPCHPSLADLPGPVDLVVLAVPNAALEAQLEAAAAAGVPAAVIFASCIEPHASGPRTIPQPRFLPWRSGWRRSPGRPGWRSAAATAWGSSTSTRA
jgi:acetate---CoA ligase (ADP-forming)